MHTHTHTHTQMHRHGHTQTHTHTQMHRHGHTQTHSQSQTQTHRTLACCCRCCCSSPDFGDTMQEFDLRVDANAKSVEFTITPHAAGNNDVSFSYVDDEGADSFVDISGETRTLFGKISESLAAAGVLGVYLALSPLGHTHIHTRTHTHTHTHIHTCTHAHMHTYTHTRRTCLCLCLQAFHRTRACLQTTAQRKARFQQAPSRFPSPSWFV